ncbi:filamentous hemagglutinin family protein [Microbacteriaceae bacterium K1510]|nr:filamentous hemagglutinin family protein [Microbacteriaceae bacterium K1510]
MSGFVMPTAALAYLLAAGAVYGGPFLTPNAPAEIYAGRDIIDLAFYGTNFTANDVTSIVAGRDITYRPIVVGGRSATPIIELAGPGHLVVQAGGDISFPSQRTTGVETGIRALGNSLDPVAIAGALFFRTVSVGTSLGYVTTFGNPHLPAGGASVSTLFGVGPGIDYAGFAAAYLDPARATTSEFLTTFAASIAAANGRGALTPEQAWTLYQAFSDAQRQIIIRKVFLSILDQTGRDYNDSASPYYHQYGRGYAAIDALFPAAYGYTANSLNGGSNGTSALVATGNLDLRGSTIQTQQGGDISLFGPGGRILVGSSIAAPAVNPASEGIITLEMGNISTFTDRDVRVAQSRVFTEQGGDILMWSSNGDLDAGRGAKTTVSFPPPVFSCDLGFYCVVDVKGVVSGAGINTLQSLPDTPPGNANLIAPRGRSMRAPPAFASPAASTSPRCSSPTRSTSRFRGYRPAFQPRRRRTSAAH